MSAIFAERDGKTLTAYSQNVVGSCSYDDAVAGATGILDNFEQRLAEVQQQRQRIAAG